MQRTSRGFRYSLRQGLGQAQCWTPRPGHSEALEAPWRCESWQVLLEHPQSVAVTADAQVPSCSHEPDFPFWRRRFSIQLLVDMA